MAFVFGAQRSAMAFVLVLGMAVAAAAEAAKAPPLNKLSDLIEPTWGNQNLIYQRDLVQLKLDSNSGAGFGSKSKYMYGKATIEMKLIQGDSAGTVTAFYMASEGPYHNEFDFEFLGNTSGEPYLVQTNVYVNGVGGREQRLSLWFDPTKDYHSYSILWTQRQVVFMVDETTIRIHVNMEQKGIPFPKGQTMGVYSSIWNADEWATQGGLLKTDWSHSPFFASFRALHVDACECPIPSAALDNMRRCSRHPYASLSLHAPHHLHWVRSNHLVYDYCVDAARFPIQPPECA
ncbi:hypothetical protein V2J09_010825 [Rumex salicifolius]